MVQETFTITSVTSSVQLSLPAYGGANRTLTKDIVLFNFWSGALTTVDKGIGDNPTVLGGIDLKGEDTAACFPLCFPLCFEQALSGKIGRIWAMQNAREEVTITGLGVTLNGVYVIKSFEIKTIKGTNLALAWRLELEWVRSS